MLSRWGLALSLTVTLVVRLGFLAASVEEHFPYFFPHAAEVAERVLTGPSPYVDPFGWEASSIACSWACGRGFGNPFGGLTGPTAWIAPGVVALYALPFAAFGCFSAPAVFAVFFLALGLSLLTCFWLYRLAQFAYGSVARATVAALAFALLPYEAWLFRVTGHLEFNLTACGWVGLMLVSLRLLRNPSTLAALRLGVATGVALYLSPNFLFASLSAALRAGWQRSWRRAAGYGAVVSLTALLAVAPYLWWQRQRLGVWVMVKSNAPFELFLGNTPEAQGVLREEVFARYHPSQNRKEYTSYAFLGEAEYLRLSWQRFLNQLSWADFLGNTARRVVHFFFVYDTKSWDRPSARLVAKKLLWALPGLLLLAAWGCGRCRRGGSLALVYLFTLGYSAPFLLTGIMDRYKAVLGPVVCFLVAGLLPDRFWLRAWVGRPASENTQRANV
ncbi:MAG: glycosyltransferase family 39 protein [Thermoanaerobaculum sp.]|nr:glycosyltransferase family 39 protein [Thermoanaerobaculum sp.]